MWAKVICSTSTTTKTIKKQDSNRHFSKDIQVVNKHVKGCSISQFDKKKANQNQKEIYHLTPITMAILKEGKRERKGVRREGGEKERERRHRRGGGRKEERMEGRKKGNKNW